MGLEGFELSEISSIVFGNVPAESIKVWEAESLWNFCLDFDFSQTKLCFDVVGMNKVASENQSVLRGVDSVDVSGRYDPARPIELFSRQVQTPSPRLHADLTHIVSPACSVTLRTSSTQSPNQTFSW